jgi:transcriptional regulator with XRE-family HTH domain
MSWKIDLRDGKDAVRLDLAAIGQRLRRLRQLRRWKEIDLAARARVQPWVIQRCERGRTLPKVHNLAQLAAALGVSLDYLLTGAEPHARPPSPEEIRQKLALAERALRTLPGYREVVGALFEALSLVGRDLGPTPPSRSHERSHGGRR